MSDLPPAYERIGDRVAKKNPGVARDSVEFRRLLVPALMFYMGCFYRTKMTPAELQEHADRIVAGDILDIEVDTANGKLKLIAKEKER